jgi:hypothetical protein
MTQADDFRPELTERLGPGVRVVKKPKRVRRYLALLVVVGFMAVVWFAFSQSGQAPGESVVPVIKADGEPIKVRPDQAGGAEIPHQDKLVYDQIAGKPLESMPERLLPEPEQPLPQTQANAVDSSPSVNVPEPTASLPEQEVAVVPQVTPKPVVEDKAPENITPPENMALKPIVPPRSAKTAEKPPIPNTAAKKVDPQKPLLSIKTAEAPAATDGFRIQVAALPDADTAQRKAEELNKKFAKTLDGKKIGVRRAEIPGKGTFYRLQAAGYSDRSAAGNACQSLKSAGQNCLVVAP